jgi:hypothetical protein
VRREGQRDLRLLALLTGRMLRGPVKRWMDVSIFFDICFLRSVLVLMLDGRWVWTFDSACRVCEKVDLKSGTGQRVKGVGKV